MYNHTLEYNQHLETITFLKEELIINLERYKNIIKEIRKEDKQYKIICESV
jgi:hypothetical protein